MLHISLSRFLAVTVVGFSILAIQGCSKKIEGEVFVVNPNGTAERLSLVKIYQLNPSQAEQFRQSIESRSKQIVNNFENAVSKIDLNELEKQLQLIDAAEEKAMRVLRQCAARQGHMSFCLGLTQELAEMQMEAGRAARKKMAQIAISIENIEESAFTPAALIAREAESYATKNNITPTKTNSEGKYLIDLSPKDNRLLAVPDSEQLQPRAIWFIDGSQIEKTLILSNDNQVGKNCKECVTLSVSSDTEKTMKQTRELVSCFKGLTESIGCDAKDFVNLVRKLKTV